MPSGRSGHRLFQARLASGKDPSDPTSRKVIPLVERLGTVNLPGPQFSAESRPCQFESCDKKQFLGLCGLLI